MNIKNQMFVFTLLGLFFILIFLKPIQADNTNNVEIINIQTQPSIIKVGDTFTVSTTLFNNYSNPLFLEHGACEALFSVTFDNHVTFNKKNGTCTMNLLVQKLNPGQKTTGTSSSYFTYKATAAGNANVTVTFSYFVMNQTDPNSSRIEKTISKSILFAISDNGTGVKLTSNTPLKQLKLGISSNDIQCKTNFMLIIKAEDGHPVCVSHNTSKILVERGWAKALP